MDDTDDTLTVLWSSTEGEMPSGRMTVDDIRMERPPTRYITADKIAPSFSDRTEEMREMFHDLKDEHHRITNKLDMIEATLANVQQQIQAIVTRLSSR